MTIGLPGLPCIWQCSWMLEPSPILTCDRSALMTANGQMLQPLSMTTSPMIIASGAT
jgi:hypothetical protein